MQSNVWMRIMAKCFMLGCNGTAVHKITDAELNPKRFNGKKICKDCNRARVLLKQEPWLEKGSSRFVSKDGDEL